MATAHLVLRDTGVRRDFEHDPELMKRSARSMRATGAYHLPFFGPDAEAYVAQVRDRLGLAVELRTEEGMCCPPGCKRARLRTARPGGEMSITIEVMGGIRVADGRDGQVPGAVPL